MKKINLLIIFILGSLLTQAQFTLVNLKTNYLSTPMGLDEAKPQFSWQMKTLNNKRNQSQKSYQILVIDEQNHTVWDTKKVDSDLSVGVFYAGETLKPKTRYTWKLIVWDNFGIKTNISSWFETGLLNTSIEAWLKSKWIGGSDSDLNFYSHYLSVFKLKYNLKIKEGSQKAAFVFGANDSRLANKYLNLMGVEKPINESFLALELDISTLSADTSTRAFLNIYRVGYTKTDLVDKPFKTIKIARTLLDHNNKHEKHMFLAECNFGVFEFYLNGASDAHKIKDASMEPAGRFAPRGLNLNPVGVGNNFISFPMLADIGFWTKAGQEAVFSGIKILNYRSPGNALFLENLHGKLFKDLPLIKDEYQVSENTFKVNDPSHSSAPLLRQTFNIPNKPIKKARLYATARGIYEAYLNGNRVSNEYFNPGLTQYNKTHSYQTFDVTVNLKSGQKNAIGVAISEGWWSGNITFSGENWNWFGDRPSFLGQLIINFTDGTEQVISSNETDWKIFTDGPVKVGSFFQGEVYDANKEKQIVGWHTASYNDIAWKNAVEVPLEGTAIVGQSKYGRFTANLPYQDFKLVGNLGDKVTIIDKLTAKSVSEVRPMVFVYDMGQNMVGIPQIAIKNGKKGQIINLRFAEITYPNLADYKGNEGMIMLENIRAALAQDRYILKGGDELIQPRFTFHGYRYLEITGIDSALPVSQVKGLVLSSVQNLSSKYETSDPLVNKLWDNINWSLKSNFLSIPTDCPQRNERMGWSGDISVFARSATYLTDANSFLKKHLLAMRDLQPESGRFTDVAPVGGGFGGTLWGSAGITVAWETFRQYGDYQLLAEHYPAMKKYIDFLETKIDKETGILNEGPLGDWLSPEGNKNDNTLFWMAYFAYDLEIVSKMAVALGKNAEAQKLLSRSQEIKTIFNNVYLDKVTKKTIKSGIQTGFMGPPNAQQGAAKSDKGTLMDTQASYAIPLALGIFSPENRLAAIDNLNNTIKRKNKDDGNIERPEFSLMTGFIGTASISEALSENGNNDVAYKLLVNKQYPSWLYSVVNGATTIWERLNSYTLENGFGGNNSMNSFNHYSFGAVAAWMYNYSLGIQRHPVEPSFKAFVLKPSPDPNANIKFAKGHYDSNYGRIESAWAYLDNSGSWSYTCTIPANTNAKLYLPDNKMITENGKPIKLEKAENGFGILDLKSGTFKFIIK